MRGSLYALFAAICGGTIGVISVFAFKSLTFYEVAFYKCFLGFIILSVLCCISKDLRLQIRILYQQRFDIIKIAILSFFGIFLLYYFETRAFSMAPVGIVTFITYSAAILTIILSYFVLKEKIGLSQIFCMLLVIAGDIAIFDNFSLSGNIEGIVYAMIGGIGYSTFLVLCRKFRIEPNLGFLWWFLLFGTIYLLIPSMMLIESITIPRSGYIYVLLLSIIPTLGGFYFITKALNCTEASKVQIIEMSDPLFATLLAFIILGETIDLQEMMGSVLILIGLVFMVLSGRNKGKRVS